MAQQPRPSLEIRRASSSANKPPSVRSIHSTHSQTQASQKWATGKKPTSIKPLSRAPTWQSLVIPGRAYKVSMYDSMTQRIFVDTGRLDHTQGGTTQISIPRSDFSPASQDRWAKTFGAETVEDPFLLVHAPQTDQEKWELTTSKAKVIAKSLRFRLSGRS